MQAPAFDNVKYTKMMLNMLRKATLTPEYDFVKFAVDPEKSSTWYVIFCNFSGNEDEFVGGEYLVRIEAPPEFPFKAPSFYFMNETGVYGVETKVCISIGEFHPENMQAALGMTGFIRELVNGLIGWRELGGGIAITNTPLETKIKHAKASKAYIREKYPKIVELVETSFKGYSAKWDLKKIPTATKIGLGLPVTPEELKEHETATAAYAAKKAEIAASDSAKKTKGPKK